jgi:hypothetical protein
MPTAPPKEKQKKQKTKKKKRLRAMCQFELSSKLKSLAYLETIVEVLQYSDWS